MVTSCTVEAAQQTRISSLVVILAANWSEDQLKSEKEWCWSVGGEAATNKNAYLHTILHSLEGFT